MEDQRICLYDNLKFFLIICVVVGHAIDQDFGNSGSDVYRSIFLFIYSFHMPLFLFISGMFHKNEYIIRKVYRNIAIGLVIKIMDIGWRVLVGEDPATSILSEYALPWFMYALAAFQVITYSVRHLNAKKILVGSAMLACFVGYDRSIGDYLILSRIVVFFPFYMAGTMVNQGKLRKVSRDRRLQILGALVLLLWGAACIHFKGLYSLRPLFTGRNPFYDYGVMLRYGCFYRLFCMVVTAIVGFSLICVMPDGRIPLVSDCGKRTLQVYCWHNILLMVLLHFNVNLYVMENIWTKILWLLLAVAISFVTATKWFAYPTSWIISQRRESPGRRLHRQT